MDFKKYQESAEATDAMRDRSDEDARVVSLLGLASEGSGLLSAYKKFVRDGESFAVDKEAVREELGDTLWYLSTVATHYGLDLNDIAEANLAKVRQLYLLAKPSTVRYFDDAYPASERIPRAFTVTFRPDPNDSAVLLLESDGRRLGSPLRDNSYAGDDYRFHDAFHLAYAAHLAWSPVTRFFFKCKRKSDSKIDEVEDGGRAIAIEEGIAAFIFDEAKRKHLYEGVTKIDYALIKQVRRLVEPFEVCVRTEKDWESTILAGFRVFRQLRENLGGTVSVDLESRSIEYVSKCQPS